VSECVITYDGVPTYSVSLMEITDGLVTHETQYFADPFPAAPGRAALAEPIPALSDLKKEIAERNEQAHKQARELRATREQKELGISARHRLDLDR
jgi:hypothetical protein